MSTPTHRAQTAAGIAEWAYPTSALLSFLALRSICLYNRQAGFPKIADAFVRRKILLALVLVVISTYAASSITILIRAAMNVADGVDENKSAYLFYAAAVWAFAILFWPQKKEYVWYPYLTSSLICIVGEIVILEAALTRPAAFELFDLISLNIQGLRLMALAALPAIYLGQQLSNCPDNSDDEERQSLLADSSSQPSSTDDTHPHHKSYGSLGKSVAVHDFGKGGGDGTRSSADENQSTVSERVVLAPRQHAPSGSSADRILVIEDGQAVAFGTPQDIVDSVGKQSEDVIVPILEKLDPTITQHRKTTPSVKGTNAKSGDKFTGPSSAYGSPRGVGAGHSKRTASNQAIRTLTPTNKDSAAHSILEAVGSASAYNDVDVPTKTRPATPSNVLDPSQEIACAQQKVDMPFTAQKDTDKKIHTITPVTASTKRDQSSSPSKRLPGSNSSAAKLKPDVPEFVPRYMRTSTEASTCSRPHSPLSREGSRSSSPSKIHAHAPEFIPRHMRTSTDASTSSAPQSPDPTHALLSRPVSPLKLHEMKATLPSSIRIGSPKPPRPEFDRSTNLSSDKVSVSDAHCVRHGKHVLGPASGNATATSSARPKAPGDPSENLSKAHLGRYGRRDLAKSEPVSQMNSSVDGAQDSEEGLKGSGETTQTKSATPKNMLQSHRRVTAPSDPPSGDQSPHARNSPVGRVRPPRRARHWRVNRKAVRSGMSSTGGLASESSMAESSSGGRSYDQGSVPRAPVTSPSLGPIPGYAYTGMS